jgi:hypothetical protein
MAQPIIGMIEIFRAHGVDLPLTRKRVISDMAARAPERRVAFRETVLVLAYAALGQAGGWIVGPVLGSRPFSFHLAGTLYGTAHANTGGCLDLGVLQLLVFAVVPYVYFHRRYTNTDLNLRSVDRRNDMLLITPSW